MKMENKLSLLFSIVTIWDLAIGPLALATLPFYAYYALDVLRNL